MNVPFVASWMEHLLSLSSNLGFLKVLSEALNVPVWEYAGLTALLLIVFIYRALEFHFIGDLINGLRGDRIKLVYNPGSRLVAGVLSTCRTLNRRYWPTIWLCSPHLQTAFVHFHGRPPKVDYRREIFTAPDGGTAALDWLEPASFDEETPIVIIVPGLSSESFNPYLKHLAHGMTAKGWRAVIKNHRGLGGLSINSERLYHAGWTSELKWFIQYLHKKFPRALLFAVGASLGANILVKYLGEEGENTLLGGAASICNPWDLVLCDRFITRKPVQKLYDIAVATGLTDLAVRHATIISKMSNWEFIRRVNINKSRSIRMFDHQFTINVHKFETVDDYYRRSSSARHVGSVAVPLLAVSSLDDPLCSKEAIPWDECRINPNVLLAVTQHGGHLAYFEGFTAKTIWWVRAVQEFFDALISSSLVHSVSLKDEQSSGPIVDQEQVLESVVEQQVIQELVNEGDVVIREEEQQEVSNVEENRTSITNEEESTVFMDDRGLNIQVCLKNREEMVALHAALSKILGQNSEMDQSRKLDDTLSSSFSKVFSKQGLLLLAVPIVGTAIALGLRRNGINGWRKRLNLFTIGI